MIMKTMNSSIKRVVVIVMVMAAAFALPVMAQPQDYNQAIQPNATFHSTSTMTGSGSAYSSKPMLNADGTAHYNGASYSPVSGPRRVGAGTPGSGTPTTPGQGQPQNQFPIGDGLLPLLLCSLAYMGVTAIRRRKTTATR